MNDRTTLSIVIVAVVLALVVFFLEREVSTIPYQSPEKYKVLRGLTVENVKKISLLAVGDQTVHLTRGGSRWFFERPLRDKSGYSVEWEANAETVNRLVDLLVNLHEAEPAIEGRPGVPLDLLKYGLQNPQQRIEIIYGSGRKGRQQVLLHLGTHLPGTRESLYVRVNEENRVLTISDTLSAMMKLAEEGGYAFRSRSVYARDDLADTTEVNLVTRAYRANFQKGTMEDLWEFRWVDKKGDPDMAFTARGSADTVKDLAKALQDLEVEQFIEDTASNQKLESFGFMDPQAVLSMTLTESSDSLLALFSGPPSAYLRIGKEVENAPDQVYAVATQRSPMVFTIKKSFLDSLPKEVKDLPAKRLVPFENSKVKKLSLKNALGTLSAAKKEYDWTLSAPLEMDGDHAGLNGLVDAVATTDCEDVVWSNGKTDKNFGLATPQAVLTLWHKGKSGDSPDLMQAIQVGKVFEKKVAKKKEDDKEKGKDEDKKKAEDEKKPEVEKFVYVRRVGDVGIRVFKFEKFKSFLENPLSFAKKRVLEFSSWDARSFTLERPGGRYEFKKEEDAWHMVKPAALKADQSKAGGLVSSMGWLSAESILAFDPESLAPYGLDKAPYRIEVVVKTPEEKKDGSKKDDDKKDDKKDDKEKTEKVETYVLLVAAKKEGDKETVFGQVQGGRLVFTLEKSFKEKLEAEMADTEIFPYQWKLREATVEQGDQVKRLARDADGKAFQVATGKEGKLVKAEEDAGRKFFEKLAATKVLGHYLTYEAKDLTPYGLAKDLFARITSKDKDEKIADLEVGKAADEAKHGKGLRFARRAGKSAVFLVKQEDLDALLKPVADFLPKKPEEEKKEK